MRVLLLLWGGASGSGHPADKLGFVFGAGIKLNAPIVGQGDYFQAQINYTQGASAVRLSNAQYELGQGQRPHAKGLAC